MPDFPSQTKPRDYWLDIDNRREFFEGIAAELDFDPLVPENWKTVPKRVIAKRVCFLSANFLACLPSFLLVLFFFPFLFFPLHFFSFLFFPVLFFFLIAPFLLLHVPDFLFILLTGARIAHSLWWFCQGRS